VLPPTEPPRFSDGLIQLWSASVTAPGSASRPTPSPASAPCGQIKSGTLDMEPRSSHLMGAKLERRFALTKILSVPANPRAGISAPGGRW
jgi:hypothetical protein